MNKKKKLFQIKMDENELSLFRKEMENVKPIQQDKIFPVFKQKKVKQKYFQHKKSNDVFYFSDSFHAIFEEDPLSFVRSKEDKYELKKLKNDFYAPEFFLDLHGLFKEDAKRELSALILACQNQRTDSVHCALIIHGHGKNILKKSIPNWLAQHPSIICFHQAPRKLGGNSGILALIEPRISPKSFND